MPKMLIVDTYYPAVLDYLAPSLTGLDYDASLAATMDLQFGTSDFYSRHLRSFGWDVQDVIINSPHLQSLWAQEHGISFDSNVIDHQIEAFQPDVLFLQNLTCLGAKLHDYRNRFLIAGQCSCAMRREVLPDYHVIFTSFPHYISRYNRLMKPDGRIVFNPLSFEPAVLRTPTDAHLPSKRPFDIVFVGGVGRPSHWSYGMRVLETVARAFPDRFQWWGYGADTLPGDSPLIPLYRGPAWGRQMYDIFSDSKIVVNRHGEIADSFANNMRLYEATGCGALLMTEQKANLGELFNPDELGIYTTPDDAVKQIDYYLAHPLVRESFARNGQIRTLQDHTYRERMKVVSDVILEAMDGHS